MDTLKEFKSIKNESEMTGLGAKQSKITDAEINSG